MARSGPMAPLIAGVAAGTVAADQSAHGGAQSLSLNGDGSINRQPFKLTAAGDPLITAERHKPYTVASDIQAGRTKVRSSITLTKPFDLGSVVADIDALRQAAQDLGCGLGCPFGMLSFLALPVIPELRITDQGLYDVAQQEFVRY